MCCGIANRYSYVFMVAGVLGFLLCGYVSWWVRSRWLVARSGSAELVTDSALQEFDYT